MDREYYEFWQRISKMRFNEKTVLIDFLSGSNGHFFEYSINTQLYGAKTTASPFTDIYTIQTWRLPDDYQSRRECFAVHWTQHDLPLALVSGIKLIRVGVSQLKSKLICFFNQILRAGDRPFWKFTEEELKDHDQLRRSLFYTLTQLDQVSWKELDSNVLTVELEDLTDRGSTIKVLNQVSQFLGQDINIEQPYLDFCDTYFLHQQGPISYQRCVEFINGVDHKLDILEQVAVCYIKSTNQPGKKPGDIIDHLLSGKFDPNKFRNYW